MGTVRNGLKNVARRAAAAVPGVRRLMLFGGQQASGSAGILQLYSRQAPSPAAPFDIFKDDWSSEVPGFKTGASPLFDDSRIKWLESQLGSFEGKRVLELGPLEGGHTFMMERAGATVTAIEANQRAFLKCLIVKDAFHLKSEFLFGDFRPYLSALEPRSFDLSFSGWRAIPHARAGETVARYRKNGKCFRAMDALLRSESHGRESSIQSETASPNSWRNLC